LCAKLFQKKSVPSVTINFFYYLYIKEPLNLHCRIKILRC